MLGQQAAGCCQHSDKLVRNCNLEHTNSSCEMCIQEMTEDKKSLVQQLAEQKIVSKRREDNLVTQAAAQQRKVVQVCPKVASLVHIVRSCLLEKSVLALLLCVKLLTSFGCGQHVSLCVD